MNNKLMKVLGVYNKEKYFMVVWTRGASKGFDLYLMRDTVEEFLSDSNKPIFSTDYGDTVEELIGYLKKHEGFKRGRY